MGSGSGSLGFGFGFGGVVRFWAIEKSVNFQTNQGSWFLGSISFGFLQVGFGIRGLAHEIFRLIFEFMLLGVLLN